jgi:putative ribosome biogenesis GTPase RsgA
MSKRLTSEQIEALERAIQGYNILVLGQSCMGKSFLIQEIEKK